MTCCDVTCTSSSQKCCDEGYINTDNHCCKKGQTWDKDAEKCVDTSTLPINYIPLSLVGAFLPLVGWRFAGSNGFIVGFVLNFLLNMLFFWTMARSVKYNYQPGTLLAATLILAIIWGFISILLLVLVIVVVDRQHGDNKIVTVFMIMVGTILSTGGGFGTGSLIFK